MGLFVSVVLIFVGLVFCGNATRILRATEWQKHKPFWWLCRELTWSDSTLKAAADDELFRRLEANELSGEQIRSLARLMLTPQASPSAYPRISVECIADLREKGGLKDREVNQIRQNMVRFMPRAPLVVRRGLPFQYDIAIELVEGHRRHTGASFVAQSAEVDGESIKCAHASCHLMHYPEWSDREHRVGAPFVVLTQQQWDKLAPGKHVLRVTLSPSVSMELRWAEAVILPPRVVEFSFDVFETSSP
jgi:hypothetical protein